MHITCKCLNVSIKSKGDELRKINIDDIELSTIERENDFFNENIATVPDLEGITKEQPGLIVSENIGSWIINRCLNCDMYTHAVHREYGAALVLINANIIISLETIGTLKSSPDYSPVFRVIIKHDTLNDFDYLRPPSKFSVSQLPNTTQIALGGLQQQLEEAVQQKVAEIEEKIRAFTLEQSQLLEQFREKTHKEHMLLARTICNREELNRLTNNIETPPTTPDSYKINITNSNPHSMSTKSQNISSNVKHNNYTDNKNQSHIKYIDAHNGNTNDRERSYNYNKEMSNFDTEVIFPLEGMDDPTTDDHPILEDDSDTDGHEEGIHMPREHRSGHPTLAKSLPVSVPTFPTFVHHILQDQDDEQSSRDPFDPHNIRASMKALAKSVNSDAVFGDLPRPRFSTQI